MLSLLARARARITFHYLEMNRMDLKEEEDKEQEELINGFSLR